MATLTKPIVPVKNGSFMPKSTTRATNVPVAEMAKEVSRMNKKANDRIRALTKQGTYSYALEARYRHIHNTHRDTKVDYAKVLEEAKQGKLNFRMPESQKRGFNNASYKYDQKAVYEASNSVYDFLNAKTSTKTGIYNWLNEVKHNFGLITNPEFNALSIDDQISSLKEAFHWLYEVEQHMETLGEALTEEERYRVTEYMADQISKGGFNTSGMTIDEITESIKKLAEELTQDTTTYTDFSYKGKTFHFS